MQQFNKLLAQAKTVLSRISTYILLGILLCISAIFVIQQHNIILLTNRVNELESHNIVKAIDYNTSIAALEEQVIILTEENAMQAGIIASQAEELNYYKEYILNMADALTEYQQALQEAVPYIQFPIEWEGPTLTKAKGCIMGPSGRETYYNLNMKNCIKKMRQLGYTQRAYPYWIREDGAKMLGPYVMIAANWSIRPLGSIVETSLGWGIVVDTGEFINTYPYGVDIATTW